MDYYLRTRGSVYSAALICILLIILVIYGRPKIAILLYNQGARYYDQGLYREAAASFQRSLLFDSQASITHYTLGNVYTKLGQDIPALAEYKKTIQIDPGSVKAYSALSDVYLKQGNYQEAVNWLNEAQQINPDDATVKNDLEFALFEYLSDCLNKGVDAFLKGDKKHGFSLLQTALSINPDFAYTHYTLGYFYYEEGSYALAEAELCEAIRLNPAFSYAYKLLGDIYFKKQEYQKVIGMYRSAVDRNPGNSVFENDLGIVLMLSERYEEAIPHLREALSLDPGNPSIRYSLASVYRDSNRPDEAVAEYNRLLAAVGNYPNVHSDLGDIYVLKNENERAAAEYNREVEYAKSRLSSRPDDLMALMSLARAYNGLGKRKEAKGIVDKALAVNPEFREAYLTLGRIYEKAGKLKEAIAAFDKAKTLSIETNLVERDIARVKNRISAERNIFIPDVVFLKNGRHVEGKIVSESDDKVVLELSMGGPRSEVSLYRATINYIVRNSSED